ncbi:MAG: hypothetical protein ACU85E_07670, partial [Gammaproteobacteria bacterium]
MRKGRLFNYPVSNAKDTLLTLSRSQGDPPHQSMQVYENNSCTALICCNSYNERSANYILASTN